MRLPQAPLAYDRSDQTQTRSLIEQAFEQALRRGQDVEVAGGRLILQSPDGSRFAIAVSNAGTLSATAL
jgi:hypothetical protein